MKGAMHPAKYVSAELRRWAGRVIFWLAVILTGLFLGREAIRLGSA